MTDRRRHLPSVSDALAHPRMEAAVTSSGRKRVLDALRGVLDRERDRALSDPVPTLDELATKAASALMQTRDRCKRSSTPPGSSCIPTWDVRCFRRLLSRP